MSEDAGGLDDVRLLRYSRHLLLNEFGVEAQECFGRAHVVVVGVGGLGAPAALFLAAAGVGHLTLADPDAIDLTNLQRQILFREHHLGKAKAQAARSEIQRLNADVSVTALVERLGAERLSAAVGQADLVLDCSDNFVTRYAINAACVAHKKPLISGAAVRFDGQLSVFDLRRADAPCYACLFPDSKASDEDNCATLGVFAPLTGVIGCMQAGEALKCLAGVGRLAVGRVLLYNALETQWQTIQFERDPGCPVCASSKVPDAATTR